MSIFTCILDPDCHTKVVTVNNQSVTLNLWDTVGQERYVLLILCVILFNLLLVTTGYDWLRLATTGCVLQSNFIEQQARFSTKQIFRNLRVHMSPVMFTIKFCAANNRSLLLSRDFVCFHMAILTVM